jgi:hypothetical protein
MLVYCIEGVFFLPEGPRDMHEATAGFVFGVMLLIVSSALAQTDVDIFPSEPCRATSSANLQGLEIRKQELERTITTARIKVDFHWLQ